MSLDGTSASGNTAADVPVAEKRGQHSPLPPKNQRSHWFMVPGRLEDGGFSGAEIGHAALGMP